MTQAGDLVLDADRYAAAWRGKAIRLTVTEFLLLEALARRPGHVKSRDQLLQAAYPHDTTASDRTIDSHVKRLRRKFQDVDAAFDAIESVYGAGYRLRTGRSMSRVRTWAARLARGHTRLAVRLFLFNALLVFLPVAGLWYLDAYEQHLLEQQERAMVQQARLLAAALAEFPDLSAIGDGLGPQRLLDRLEQSSDVRLRIIAPDGRVVADSQRVPGLDGREDTGATSAPEMRVLRGRWTYRAGAWFGRRWRSLTSSETRPPAAETILVGPGRIKAPEVDRAFAGGYGAATRLSSGGQRSVTLYGAWPVTREGRVGHVVLVSQSTFRILQRLYDVRLRMFQVVVVSLAVALAFTVVASLTIVRPLRQLRDDAEALVDHHGRRLRAFRGTARRDEIGELARALEELTAAARHAPALHRALRRRRVARAAQPAGVDPGVRRDAGGGRAGRGPRPLPRPHRHRHRPARDADRRRARGDARGRRAGSGGAAADRSRRAGARAGRRRAPASR